MNMFYDKDYMKELYEVVHAQIAAPFGRGLLRRRSKTSTHLARNFRESGTAGARRHEHAKRESAFKVNGNRHENTRRVRTCDWN